MSFNVSYNFEAIDKFSPVLRKINSSFNRLKNNLPTISEKLGKLGKNLSGIGKKISMRVGAPLAAMGVLSVKTATDFEASMNMVRAVSGATGKAFKQLKNQALEIGMSTQYSARQSGVAMKYLALSGMKPLGIIKAMPASINLAASAQMDLGAASKVVLNIMHGYGSNANKLNDINDVLVGTFTSTNTTLQDLGQGMSRLGPIARLVKMPIQEAAAAIGLVGQAGIPGYRAGRMFVQAIKHMSSASGTAKKAIHQFGLKFFNAKGKILPLVTIIKELKAAQLTAAGYSLIFGTNAGPVMAALVGQGTDAADALIKSLYKMHGITKNIAKTQMEGLPGATKRLGAAFEHVRIVLVETNKTLVVTLINTMRKALLSVSNLNPGIKKLIGTIWSFGIVLGPVLLSLGKIIGLIALVGRGAAIAKIASIGTVFGQIGLYAAGAAITIYMAYKQFKKMKMEVIGIGAIIISHLLNPIIKLWTLVTKILHVYKLLHRIVPLAPVMVAPPRAPARDLFSPSILPRAAAALTGGASMVGLKQQVTSALNIRVDDRSNIIKSMTGESDADMFNMDIGTNMLLSR